MTDKIKSAQEVVESGIKWYNGTEKVGYIDLISFEQMQTILEALSAYEKLQGVDLDTVKEIEERWGNRFLELEEPVPEGMKRGGYVVDIHFLLTQLKSAKLVADIGGK